MEKLICPKCGSIRISETVTTLTCIECGDVLQKIFNEEIYIAVKQPSNCLKIEDWAVNSGWVKKEVLLKWIETNNPPMSELKEQLK